MTIEYILMFFVRLILHIFINTLIIYLLHKLFINAFIKRNKKEMI